MPANLDWLNIIVVDDESTDGHPRRRATSEFREVHLIQGNGNLWWTGSDPRRMETLMREAVCVLWLNDDTPHQNVLRRMTAVAVRKKCIASARKRVALDQPSRVRPRRHRKISKHWKRRLRDFVFRATMPREGILDVDACRGSCVAVPRTVVERIGSPDSVHLSHFYGDTDYTRPRQRHPLRHWGFFAGAIIFARPYLKMMGVTLVRVLIPDTLYRPKQTSMLTP